MQCRFCGRQIANHDVRHRSPYQCCKLCVDFVSSLNSPTPIEFYAILLEKPSKNLRQLTGQLIAKYNLQHKQINDQPTMFDLVNTLRQELENEILNRILQYDKDFILLAFLRLLNLTFNLTLEESNAISRKTQSLNRSLRLHRILSVNEKSLESLVERCLTLPATSYRNRKGLDIADIKLILELTREDWALFQFIEDQLCVEIGQCSLNFADDEWYLERDKDSQAVSDTIQNELKLEEERISKSTAPQEDDDDLLEKYRSLRRGKDVEPSALLDSDEIEFIGRIDDLHQRSFGYKYSELIIAYLLLIRRCATYGDLELRWDFVSRLTDYLIQNIPCEREQARNIIETMSMSETKIPEGRPMFQFKREIRILRNPLVMIQIGQRQLCLYSASFLILSDSHVSIEYFVGNYPLLLAKRHGSVLAEIQRINQNVKDYFVQSRVLPLLNSKGFKVKPLVKSIGGTKITTPQCGEIDILAYDDSEGVVILAECKHTIHPVSSVRQMRNSVAEYRDKGGFVDVLDRKLKWMTINSDKVRQEFGIIATDSVCKGMFVTNLYEPASEIVKTFPILSEEKLKSLDSRQIVAIAQPSRSSSSSGVPC
jgi:hypothetical protein